VLALTGVGTVIPVAANVPDAVARPYQAATRNSGQVSSPGPAAGRWHLATGKLALYPALRRVPAGCRGSMPRGEKPRVR
jgi:hypothetical protein